MQTPLFYVYAVRANDMVLYVGKGSGRRHLVSARKSGGHSDIIERFDCERQAYAAERKWIKALKPELNRHPGGNGSRASKARKPRTPIEIKKIEEVGARAYAARLLLGAERSSPGIIDASKIDALRSVARGCRA